MSYSQKIDVPNVVVSFINRPLAEAIQFIKSGARENSSYLFRIPNDNIIKFTHSFNFNKSEGDDIGAKITLETIDPEGFFESTLFGNSGQLGFSDKFLNKLRDDALDNINKRLELRKKLDDFSLSGIGFGKRDTVTGSVDNENLFRIQKFDAPSRSTGIVGVNLDPWKPDAPISTLSTQLNSVLQDEELTNLILSKLKERKSYSLSYTKDAVSFIGPVVFGGLGVFESPIPDVGRGESLLGVVEKISPSAISDIYNELNIGDDLKDLNILPTPYFYFYYGIGDNPNQWSGPIAAQMTNARYNYAAENGKKSIELEFATTFNFPAFSKLSLDKRGFLSTLKTPIRLCQILVPEANSGNYSLNPAVVVSNGLHLCIKNVITDYIKSCTTEDINVIILLPDIEKIVSKVAFNYFSAYETSTTNPNLFKLDALRADAYIKMYQDMGFSVARLNRDDIESFNNPNNISQLGGSITLKNTTIGNYSVGYGSDALSFYERAKETKRDSSVFVGLSLKKDHTESFRKPLERLLSGMNNKISPNQLCLEIIDNLEYVKEFKEYCKSTNGLVEYANIINEKMPIVVFGDRYLIEKYLYGKKYYELENILERREKTQSKNLSEGLSYEDRLLKYASESKTGNTYLHKFDTLIFSDKYIINLASKWFLKKNNVAATNNFSTFPYGDYTLTDTTRLNLKKASIPIFKSGVTESNILNIDLNLNDYYFAMLRSVWQSKDTLNLIYNSNGPEINQDQLSSFITSNSLEDLKVEVGIMNMSISAPDSLELGQVFKVLLEDSKFLSLSEAEKESGIKNIVLFLAQQLEQRRNDPSTPAALQSSGKIKIIVGSHESVNPYLQYLTMFSKVVNNAFLGYVKTLPIFYLSGPANSLPPIILLLEETNVPPYDKKNFITRAFNGMWSILGYKHTISNDELSSEFWIVKDIRLEIPLIIQPRS